MSDSYLHAIHSLFLRTMAKATDDWILRGGPPPNDDTFLKIEPRLAGFIAMANEPEDDMSDADDGTSEERVAESAEQRHDCPLFSQRMAMANEALRWCDKEDVEPLTFNIVTALFRLGLVQKPQPALTDGEREALRQACDEGRWYPNDYHHIHTLRGLLERLG